MTNRNFVLQARIYLLVMLCVLLTACNTSTATTQPQSTVMGGIPVQETVVSMPTETAENIQAAPLVTEQPVAKQPVVTREPVEEMAVETAPATEVAPVFTPEPELVVETLIDERYEVMFVADERDVYAREVKSDGEISAGYTVFNRKYDALLVGEKLVAYMGRPAVLVDREAEPMVIDGETYVLAYMSHDDKAVPYYFEEDGLVFPDYDSITCDPRINCDQQVKVRILQSIWLAGNRESSFVYFPPSGWANVNLDIWGVYLDSVPFQGQTELEVEGTPMAMRYILYSPQSHQLYITQFGWIFRDDEWAWVQDNTPHPTLRMVQAYHNYNEAADKFYLSCGSLNNPQSVNACQYYNELDPGSVSLDMAMKGQSTPDTFAFANAGPIWGKEVSYPISVTDLLDGVNVLAHH